MAEINFGQVYCILATIVAFHKIVERFYYEAQNESNLHPPAPLHHQTGRVFFVASPMQMKIIEIQKAPAIAGAFFLGKGE